MTFSYGDIIVLKDGVKPQMSLDKETFFGLFDDDNDENVDNDGNGDEIN